MDRKGPFVDAREIGTAAAHRHRSSLAGGARSLAQALAEADRDPHWPERACGLLTVLRRALADHVRVTEGADGCYAEVVDDAPRLARTVRQLTKDHAVLEEALTLLTECLDDTEPPPDVRHRAADLLNLLARHRQRGADMLHAAYATDLGGET